MKVSEVIALSPDELQERLTGLKKDLFFLRMQHATNQLDNPIRISQVRKDIARVKTVIRQQQLEQTQEVEVKA
jgi:large subunit ribosomal protein L29